MMNFSSYAIKTLNGRTQFFHGNFLYDIFPLNGTYNDIKLVSFISNIKRSYAYDLVFVIVFILI